MPSLFQKFQKLCFESIFISLWVNSEPPLRYLHPGLGACPEIHKRQFDFSQKVEKLFGFWLYIVSPNVKIGVHYHYAPRPQLSFFMKPRNDHWFATKESLKVWSLHSSVFIFSWQRKQLDSCHMQLPTAYFLFISQKFVEINFAIIKDGVVYLFHWTGFNFDQEVCCMIGYEFHKLLATIRSAVRDKYNCR